LRSTRDRQPDALRNTDIRLKTHTPPHSRISAEAHPGVQAVLVRFFRGEAVADTRLTLPPPKFLVL
jgi:hypothetical protein